MRKTIFQLILRLFHMPISPIPTEKKGLIIVLIDGLSYVTLQKAMQKGYCLYLSQLLSKKYSLYDYFCGVPAATTATEAELFFGSSDNIPGFTWYDRSLKKCIRGNRAETIELFEKNFNVKSPLLKNGSCIGGVYWSQADQYSLTGKDLKTNQPLYVMRKILHVLFVLLNPLRFCLTIYLLTKNLIVGFYLLIVKKSKKKFISLMRDSFSSIFLGNLLTYIAELEIVRETPILFIDFLLYDEFAHTYGVTHKHALSSLRLIDWYCKSLHKLSQKVKRKYDFIIMSDHGQTPSIPYPNMYDGLLEKQFQLALGDTNIAVIKTQKNESFFQHTGKSALYLLPGGSCIHGYFSQHLDSPILLKELESKYPRFINTLIADEYIGWILVRKDEKTQILIGKHGNIEFSDKQVSKIHNNAFKNREVSDEVIRSLARFASFSNNGDVLFFGNLLTNGRLVSFEDHMGTHGGFLGDMTKPFIMTDIISLKHAISQNTDMHQVFKSLRSIYQSK